MAFSASDDHRDTVAYCPSCSATLTPRVVHDAVARVLGQQHAQITGHVVNVVLSDTWTVVGTLAGEPSLPLWD